MDPGGVGAILRRCHPQVVRLDVRAPSERQVVTLAVLQSDALHTDILAILEVKGLWSSFGGAILGRVKISPARLRPPLLPPAVDDAAAAHRQVPRAVEVEPLAAVAVLPVVRALRRDDIVIFRLIK